MGAIGCLGLCAMCIHSVCFFSERGMEAGLGIKCWAVLVFLTDALRVIVPWTWNYHSSSTLHCHSITICYDAPLLHCYVVTSTYTRWWRTTKEVGLLSEDHLPQSMTKRGQLLN